MVDGIIGRKVDMTQIYDEKGLAVPVTVIEAGPNYITQVRTSEKDGYQAVQLGFEEVKKLKSPAKGHLKKLPLVRHLREFRANETGDLTMGQKIETDIFKPGDLGDVTGISKGRGFTGVVNRHGFRGGPKTPLQKDRHRAAGSVASPATPGRVFKGMRMAGRSGHARVTVQNLQVIEADPQRNLLLVRGCVPGAKNGLLMIKKSRKAG